MMMSKKKLKQQYLETKTRAGVYLIRNQVTGRAFIAGSANAEGALSRCRFELRHGLHRHMALAQDWAEYGEDNFIFEVLDTVKPSDDPAFNAAQALDELVSLWRQEIPSTGQFGYDHSRSKP